MKSNKFVFFQKNIIYGTIRPFCNKKQTHRRQITSIFSDNRIFHTGMTKLFNPRIHQTTEDLTALLPACSPAAERQNVIKYYVNPV